MILTSIIHKYDQHLIKSHQEHQMSLHNLGVVQEFLGLGHPQTSFLYEIGSFIQMQLFLREPSREGLKLQKMGHF